MKPTSWAFILYNFVFLQDLVIYRSKHLTFDYKFVPVILIGLPFAANWFYCLTLSFILQDRSHALVIVKYSSCSLLF